MADASIPRAVRCRTAMAVAVCGSAKAASPTIAASPTTASSTGVAGSGASASGAVQQELEAYRACLQEHGVENGAGAPQFSAYLSCLSDNGVDAGTETAAGGRGLGAIDRSTLAFIAANDKCKVLLADGVDPFAPAGRGGPPGAVPTGVGTVADLAVGETIIVQGEAGNDGNIVATTLRSGTAGLGGGALRGGTEATGGR